MTTGEEAVFALLDLLNAAEIPYMLVGSFSSNAWGEARSTKDADFVVQLAPEKRAAFVQWCKALKIIESLEKLRRESRLSS